VATLVTFHAHPDDESILCGGVMARAADEGHRVVLVVATRGELGEIPEGLLADGEELWQRRVEETQRAAATLGVARVEFLGYRDSGMMGTPDNDAPGTFWTAPVEEAAAKLAAILTEEQADVFTTYDDNGGYGHPDHIQTHRVGMRAAELAGTPRVYQATMNREHMAEGLPKFAALLAEAGIEMPGPSEDDDTEFGKPEAELTTAVDVRAYVLTKQAAMRAHASQISEQSFFLALPREVAEFVWGTEWFIRVGAPGGITESDIMAGK
jgi:LmbE family N-acetylglucosaminyl deacetylase